MTVVVQPRPLDVRKTLFVGSVLVALFIYTYFIRTSPGPQNPVFEGSTMGTTYTIKVVGSHLSQRELRQLSSEIDALLAEINRQMSTYIANSEISQFNQSTSTQAFVVSPAFARVTRRALEISRDTDGAFDPTLGPLIDLWGFGGVNRESDSPTPAQIHHALAGCGYTHLRVPSASTLQKEIAGLQINLSAIAKGFGVDELSRLLAEWSLTNTYAEIGGELRVRGHNLEGSAWRIGIDTPLDHAATGADLTSVLSLTNHAVATSGDYRNYFQDPAGTRRSHLIDPRTGIPVTHALASATVVAEDCMTADALATALMILGPADAMSWVEGQPGVEAMLIVRTDAGFQSKSSRWHPGLDRKDPLRICACALEEEEISYYRVGLLCRSFSHADGRFGSRIMKKISFNEALNQILSEDPRYDAQAYHFIREALEHTIKHFRKPVEGPGRHVSGTELLEGIRQFALQEFGPLAFTVLRRWGVNETVDFGHLVFKLVDTGVLGKTEDDRLEDFADGFSFDEAFRSPFLPQPIPTPAVAEDTN